MEQRLLTHIIKSKWRLADTHFMPNSPEKINLDESTTSLKRKLSWVIGCSIVATSIVAAFIVMVPLYLEKIDHKNQEILFQIELQSTSISNYISKLKDIGKQVASRTRVRLLLERLNIGNITLEQFQHRSRPMLDDALKGSEDLLALKRFDKNKRLVVSLGPDFSTESVLTNPGSIDFLTESNKVNGLHYRDKIAVSVKILNRRKELVGYDCLLFDSSQFMKQLEEQNIDYGVNAFEIVVGSKENGRQVLIHSKDWVPASLIDKQLGIDTAKLQTYKDYIYAIAPIINHNWIYIQRFPRYQHFDSLRSSMLPLMGFCFLLIGMGFIIARHFLNPILKKLNAATELNKQKAQFISNISHEIRTPLNGIIGMSEIIQGEALSEDLKEKFGVIKRSGDTLLNLINDILDFSKINAGKMELEKIPVNLTLLISDILSIFSTNNSRKNDFDFEYDESVPEWIYSDPLRLKQILSNLVGNANKFTTQGNIKIKITCVSRSPEVVLEFCVEDTGRGIPEDKLRDVFQPFSQSDLSTTRMFGGTGLGLSISQGLTQLFGGYMWIESKEGVGTKFYFTIKTEQAPQQRNETPADIEKKPKFATKQLRILVAEDNEVNRDIARLFLSKQCDHLSFACNGQEAVNLALKEDFDVILMDCHMPILDGYQATGIIIEKLGQRRPKIYALSASVLKEEQEKCRACGMDGFLGKPIRPDDIRDVLEVIAEEKAMSEKSSPKAS